MVAVGLREAKMKARVDQEKRRKGFFARMIDKMDKKMQEKAKAKSCCGGEDNPGKKSCCS